MLAVFVTACKTTPPGPGPDGGLPMGAGVAVSWRSTPPAFPASLEDNLVVNDVTFQAGSLDVVGTAGPGDPRTTEQNFQLTWGASGGPMPVTFADAPSGPYSGLALVLDGHFVTSAISIHGTYNNLPFTIDDRSPFSVSLQLDRTLEAGGSVDIGVKIDFHDAITSIDWENAPIDDGTHYEIDGSLLQSFLSKLAEDIQIDDSVQ